MPDTASSSVIATVRDEPRSRLERMVAAVAAQQFDAPIELLIACPPTDVGTVRALKASGAIARISAIDNPTGGRSAGLNRCVAAASSPFIHRIDARSSIPPEYVARCQARLTRDQGVGVVGGRQQPVAAADGAVARGVARALANPFITGGAAYRRAGASGPVDTVYLGSYRRQEFFDVGGYDERLDANEDFDLCQRYRGAGKAVWLEADLVVSYEARAGIRALWRQYEAFGRSKVRYWQLRDERPNPRQAVGLAAPALPAVAIAALPSLAGRHPVAALATLGLGCGGSLVLDAASRDGVFGEHILAAVGAVVIPSAWAFGAYRESARRSRARRRRSNVVPTAYPRARA